MGYTLAKDFQPPEPQPAYDERGVYRPAWDGIGNLVALYKDGVEAAVYEYSPYGEMLRSRGPYADHNPIRYGSKLADPLTGLIDFGKRHYSPALARFITRDPLQEQGGLNLYRYAGNDPINAIDVLGLALVDQPASNAFLTTGGLSGNLSNGTSNNGGSGNLKTYELDPFTVHGANNINLDTHWTNVRTNYNPFLTSDARGMPVYDYKYTWHGASMAEIASIYEARQEAILRRAEMTFNSEAHEESKKKAERERGTRLEDEMPGDFWGADIDQGLGEGTLNERLLGGMGSQPGMGVEDTLSLFSFTGTGAGALVGLQAAEVKAALENADLAGKKYPYRLVNKQGLQKIAESVSKLKSLQKYAKGVTIFGLAVDAAVIYAAQPGRGRVDATVSAGSSFAGGVIGGVVGGLFGPWFVPVGAVVGSQIGGQLTYSSMQNGAQFLQGFGSPIVAPPQYNPDGFWY